VSTTLTTTTPTAPAAEKLAYSQAELCAALGLSKVTLWRLEKRNLLRPVPGIRNKIYSRRAVEAFLEGRAE
jgi:transcriptional regulator with XRE-family HTH domain